MCVESTQCVRDLVLVLQENEGIQEKRLEEAFERMDTSEDKMIDVEEWKKFIRNQGSLHDESKCDSMIERQSAFYIFRLYCPIYLTVCGVCVCVCVCVCVKNVILVVVAAAAETTKKEDSSLGDGIE